MIYKGRKTPFRVARWRREDGETYIQQVFDAVWSMCDPHTIRWVLFRHEHGRFELEVGFQNTTVLPFPKKATMFREENGSTEKAWYGSGHDCVGPYVILQKSFITKIGAMGFAERAGIFRPKRAHGRHIVKVAKKR